MIIYTCDVCGKTIGRSMPYTRPDLGTFGGHPLHLCPECVHISRNVSIRDTYVTALRAAKQAEQPATPPRPLTNFDVITASPEALAEWFCPETRVCRGCSLDWKCGTQECKEHILAHLTAPAEEAQTDD